MRFLFFLLLASPACFGQMQYTVDYSDTSSGSINVTIQLPRPVDTGFVFVMARSIPGGYSILLYDKYVKQVSALDSLGQRIAMKKHEDDAPEWIAEKGPAFSGVRYTVDILAMQKDLGSDASVVSPGYAGILNYSILGWIKGRESEAVSCQFLAPSGWPVFSTIDPNDNPATTQFHIRTPDFYRLADGQTMLGNFQVKKFPGLVPLYVASHADLGQEYLDDLGWWGTESMKILKDYFGALPFEHYTVFRQSLHLLDDAGPTLAMEHLNSGTFTVAAKEMLTGPVPPENRMARMFGILHHMGHSFIPLRCYGDAYLPHVLPIAPVIRNIWFNEGFIWFICADTLKSPALSQRLEKNAFHEDPEIASLTLYELSAIASTQYAADFRLGQACFSRGAMMARDFDAYIKEKTGGKKSIKDVFRYLYQWSLNTQRPFTLDEFPLLIMLASGVDCSAIYQKWAK